MVIGFFGMVLVAPFLQQVFDIPTGRTRLLAPGFIYRTKGNQHIYVTSEGPYASTGPLRQKFRQQIQRRAPEVLRVRFLHTARDVDHDSYIRRRSLLGPYIGGQEGKHYRQANRSEKQHKSSDSL